jgi:hypothetical protein
MKLYVKWEKQLPGLVNVDILRTGKIQHFSWENSLFRLGHFHQRVFQFCQPPDTDLPEHELLAQPILVESIPSGMHVTGKPAYSTEKSSSWVRLNI